MKKFLATIILVSLALPCIASDEGSAKGKTAEPASHTAAAQAEKDRAQIIDTVNRFNQAAVRNDLRTMSRLLADNYSAKNDQGATVGKQDVLRAQRTKAMQYQSVEMHDVEVQLNGDFAVEKDVSDVHGTWHGRPFSGSFASVRTLEKRNGEWQMVAFEMHDQK